MTRISFFSALSFVITAVGVSAQVPPLGQVTVTHVFNGAGDSPNPQYGLIELPNGNFAGVTQGNHANLLASRMVYEMTPGGEVTPLVHFGPRTSQLRNQADLGGSYQLLQASDGNFYAVASGAGPERQGNLYKLTPSGTYTIEYLFHTPSRGGLAESLDGGLYGFGMDPLTLENGIYRFESASGQLSFVYNASPYFATGTPVFGSDGNICGLNGSLPNYGVATFSFNPATAELQNTADFTYQQASGLYSDPITIDQTGNIWFSQPTNEDLPPGCPTNCGSILEATGGQASVPYSFTGQNYSGTPVSLILASDGNFYGVTDYPGEPEQVFQYNPNTRTLSTYPIPASAGVNATGPLLQDSNGYLRGTNSGGAGASSPGAAFVLNLGLPKPLPAIRGFSPASGQSGTVVRILGSHFVNVTRVTLNGQPVPFSNPAAGAVTFTLPPGATSGPIVIATAAGFVASADALQVQ